MGISKLLITCGVILIIAGGVFYFIEPKGFNHNNQYDNRVEKVPGLGKLPGDILIKKENFTFYFPLATSLLISLILSVLIYLWNHR